MERKKRLIAGLTATGVLTGALAWGGVTVASAGTGQPAAAAATPAALSAAAQQAGTTGTAKLLRVEKAGRLVVTTSATYDGITPAQLRAGLKAGKSLAALASANGKPVAGLENAIETALVNRIDASKLSATRKAALINDVKTYLDAFVNADHPFASLRGAVRAFDKHGATATATPTPTPTGTASTSAA